MNTEDRKLLADEFTAIGANAYAKQVDDNPDWFPLDCAIRAIAKARQQERERVLEEAAKVVEANQETWSSRDGTHLTPRSHGNLMGLAFAAGIRALTIRPTEVTSE